MSYVEIEDYDITLSAAQRAALGLARVRVASEQNAAGGSPIGVRFHFE